MGAIPKKAAPAQKFLDRIRNPDAVSCFRDWLNCLGIGWLDLAPIIDQSQAVAGSLFQGKFHEHRTVKAYLQRILDHIKTSYSVKLGKDPVVLLYPPPEVVVERITTAKQPDLKIAKEPSARVRKSDVELTETAKEVLRWNIQVLRGFDSLDDFAKTIGVGRSTMFDAFYGKKDAIGDKTILAIAKYAGFVSTESHRVYTDRLPDKSNTCFQMLRFLVDHDKHSEVCQAINAAYKLHQEAN